MNKTIYFTYKKEIPSFVLDRWKYLNPEYTMDFNLDKDCIDFLKKEFNPYIVDLFKNIPLGMFKADLWRLCKLYICGGAYADVDLVPHFEIDKLDKDITFYSCLTEDRKSIFQAFMATFTKPRNPLILHFLISFLHNNPYNYENGGTYDMFNCITYNLNNNNIHHNTKYDINEIKINIKIGSSDSKTKIIDLHYFPADVVYTVKLKHNSYSDMFEFNIINNLLHVRRLDGDWWGHDHSCDICIQSTEKILLFKEEYCQGKWIDFCFVSHNGKKIMDSRDTLYYNNQGW